MVLRDMLSERLGSSAITGILLLAVIVTTWRNVCAWIRWSARKAEQRIAKYKDAPTLSVVTANGNEDTAIPLSISSALIDISPTESLSLTVAGVPADATLNHGTVDGNGVWHLAGSDLADLALTPASNFSGSLSLTVTATSTESTNS